MSEKRFPPEEVLYASIKLITAVVFLGSGVVKLLDPEVFAVTLDAFGVLPESMISAVSYILPLGEIILSVCLYLDIRCSLIITTLLLLLFILILGYGIKLGLDVDCGCFGPEDPESKAFSGLRPALYRDLVMMIGIFYMYGFRIIFQKKSLQESL